MSVFISFASEDKSFAERIAFELVKRKIIVFYDQWEVTVGNKLEEVLTQQIKEADYICIILSKASVDVLTSNNQRWFKREFELAIESEKKVNADIIIPIIIDDCEIPDELQDKVRSNFRDKSFDEGVKEILLALSSLMETNTYRNQRENTKFVYDWALDWYINKERKLEITLDIVEFSREFQWSILTKIVIFANSNASCHYKKRLKEGLDKVVVYSIIGTLKEKLSNESILLSDNKANKQRVTIEDNKLKYKFEVAITSRKLGKDTGRDYVLHIGNYYKQIYKHILENRNLK